MFPQQIKYTIALPTLMYCKNKNIQIVYMTSAGWVLNLSVLNGPFSCPVLKVCSYFRIIVISESSSNSSTIYCLFIVCVLDVVCRAFYKQSMVQSEGRKLDVHPTWFIRFYSQCFSLNEIEFVSLLFMCGPYISLNNLLHCRYFSILFISCRTLLSNLQTQVHNFSK